MHMFHIPVPGHEDAILEGYLLDCEITLGQDTQRPAVLVCPGGGYVYLAPREAEPVALSYAAQGFHAFVLRYSVGAAAAGFAPLAEISWAIGYIRENSQKWHIAEDKIAVCGFSAGGHLALSAGLQAENKPNAMILCYPAASAPNMPKADFMLKALEGRENVTDADAVQYDLVPQITGDAPPVFLAATAEDLLTSFAAMPIAMAYARLNLLYELHVFQFGPHGYSLGNTVSADGSLGQVDSAFAQWQPLSVIWLNRIFGEPKLIDKPLGPLSQMLRRTQNQPKGNSEQIVCG